MRGSNRYTNSEHKTGAIYQFTNGSATDRSNPRTPKQANGASLDIVQVEGSNACGQIKAGGACASRCLVDLHMVLPPTRLELQDIIFPLSFFIRRLC